VQLGLRVKEWMRAALEESAHEHGTSINSEIVERLEKAFADEDVRAEFWGRDGLYELMKAVATVMNRAGTRALLFSGKHIASPWLNDPYAYDEALQAAVKVLEALRPPGEIRVPALPPDDPEAGQRLASLLDRLLHAGIGARIAANFLSQPEEDVIPDRERARLELGPLAARLRREQNR
jgi:hypothetical protein